MRDIKNEKGKEGEDLSSCSTSTRGIVDSGFAFGALTINSYSFKLATNLRITSPDFDSLGCITTSLVCQYEYQ